MVQISIIFKPEEMLGILDLRSLGYFKIKKGILQQNLSKYYTFERVDTLCTHFNIHKHPEKGKRTKGIKRKVPKVRPQ